MLSTASIYQAMVRAFGTVTSSDNFNSDFIQAVNNSLDELSNAAALTTAHSHVNASTANISTLDEQDAYILQAGVIVHLALAGWPHRAMSNDDAFLTRVALPLWESALGDSMVRKSRDDDQAASTEDDDGNYEGDIIFWGYRGDE